MSQCCCVKGGRTSDEVTPVVCAYDSSRVTVQTRRPATLLLTGLLNETNYTPMLHSPLPEKIWFYPIDHATNTATFKALDSDFSVKIPLHPFLGCIYLVAKSKVNSSLVQYFACH